MIKCEKCKSNVVIRNGKFGAFGGCSSYPKCNYTINLNNLKKKLVDEIYNYLENSGINIYAWKVECWKCQKETTVYTYFLNRQLNKNLDNLNDLIAFNGTLGIGDIDEIDQYLQSKIPTIKNKFSKTKQSSSISNTCEHCGSLQGRWFVVDDPHEIMYEMHHNPDEFDKNYIFCKVKPSEIENSKEWIGQMVSCYLNDEFYEDE